MNDQIPVGDFRKERPTRGPAGSQALPGGASALIPGRGLT
ncbi:MAG: hypothetical protein JWS11_529 [Cypionkella sp.]|nr:hypothetical protein [Cypionkella sp.]